MKVWDREMTTNEVILAADGLVSCVAAVAMIAAPGLAQDVGMKPSAGRSAPMTCLAGIGFGAGGMHMVNASRSRDTRVQRGALKASAMKTAVLCGMAVSQLAGKEADLVADKNKLIGFAAFTAVSTVFLAWRGCKKDANAK